MLSFSLIPIVVLAYIIDYKADWIRPAIAISVLMNYLRLFYFLRIFDNLATLVKTIIEITYDLIGDETGRTFDLNLYSSADNYSTPLTLVEGDVGTEIEPGADKTIAWKIREELGEFKGDIFLEVRGIITPPLVDIRSPQMNETFRRGKTSSILWQSAASRSLSLVLYQSGSRVASLGNNIPNTGSYTWELPKDMSKGKNYSLRFSDVNNPSKSVMSAEFTIGARYPLVLKIIPAALIGGGILYLVTRKEKEEPIVDPPLPGEDF